MLPKNAKKFDENFLKYWGLSGAKACKSCRSRQELSNEYLSFTHKNQRRYSRERASQSSFDSPAFGFNFHRAAPPRLERWWRNPSRKEGVASASSELRRRVRQRAAAYRPAHRSARQSAILSCSVFSSEIFKSFSITRTNFSLFLGMERMTILGFSALSFQDACTC